jgi:tetratricopeptide (TPR) repeat protein/serine/threonine protein kinase
MSEPVPTQDHPPPESFLERVDRVCDRFEDAWLAGRRPRIEDFLGDTTEPVRSELLRQLILVDVAHRKEVGEVPRARDYAAHCPPLDGSWLEREVGATHFPAGRCAGDGAAGTPTSAGLRFRVLRPHARGGVGEVFVARDEELHREVALKEIQAAYRDHPTSRARFLLEAEITGGLEHPGIVPVYGLGVYADGRPFYAMRFIRGDSLKDAVQQFHAADKPGRDPGERSLALRQLLGRFVAVCNAVAYAHSRGILHRDLKPANVMLGPFGETLVVDWGLAKVVGRPAGEGGAAEETLRPYLADRFPSTQVGSVIGTPGFMSPEQAAGRPDQVGPASDVYSLGATLYFLLIGKAPFDGPDGKAVLERVQRGDFPPPRRIKPEVPRALEAVCLKAMAPRPEDRYPTARALSGDVEKWLADEPVGAWREPLRLRVGRWARRHQARVAAIASGVLVAVLAGGAGAWWLDRQRAEQRQAVETTLDKVGELQGKARWTEAGALLDRELARLGDGGPYDLKARLERAKAELGLVKRLDDVRLKRATIVEGAFDAAGANKGYEEAFREAGMGEVGGDTAAAADWVRGTAVSEALVAALDDWASCTGGRRRAWLLEVARRADPAFAGVRDPAVWEDPAELARRLGGGQEVKQSPQLLAVLGWLLRGREREELLRRAQERHPGDFWINFMLGNALQESNKPEEAVGFHRAALALRPGTAAVHNNLGNAMRHRGQVAEAIAEFKKAIALDPQYALPHNNLGVALRDQHKVAEAIAEFRQAIDLDPKFALPHANLGNVLHLQGQVAEAIAEYRKALELDPKLAPLLAPAHLDLGNVLCARGRVGEAIAVFRKAIELDPRDVSAHNSLGALLCDVKRDYGGAIDEFRQAVALDPRNARAHTNLGNALTRQDKVTEAIAEYRTAIALDPRDASAHHGLGDALRAQLKVEEAIAEYRRAIALDPKNAKTHVNLGNALRDQGKVEDAIAEFRQAIAVDPRLAPAHHNLGFALYGQGQLAEATAEFRKAIDIDPRDARPHVLLAKALRDQGKVEEAIAEYRKAIALDPRDTSAHNSLGAVLCDVKRDFEGAIAEFRKTIQLDPKVARAHYNLGNALRAQGQVAEAVAEYRKAIQLDPRDASAHNNLGAALNTQGKIEEAIAEARKAIELDPRYAQAHGALGHALLQQGEFAEAKQAAQRCLALVPANHPFHAWASQLLRQCEEMQALDQKLTAVLKGEATPADAGEQMAFAGLCVLKKRYAGAARFYSGAFAAQPRLADDLKAAHRCNAARAAALAAAGTGTDAGQTDDKERARLRRQALEWLRADLTAWTRVADTALPQARSVVQQALKGWQTTPDLAGLRDRDAVNRLPEADRDACRRLWDDVAALVARVAPNP